EIAKAMGPREYKANRRVGSWSVTPYQTTHNTGGAIMGDSPASNVVNRYLQSWDCPNVFSMATGAFPQHAGSHPTAAVGAPNYPPGRAVIDQYLKSPGPLVEG